MNLEKVKSVFFIGIGGIGMSALARYFHANGFIVSGYDKTETVLTSELITEGIAIQFNDAIEKIAPEFLNSATTLVVYTPAIPKEHKQLNYFVDNGFQVKKRSQVLGMLTAAHKGICVAGTHGKTTVSTMIAHLLKQSKVDCSAFLGGVSQNYKTNLLLSDTSDYVVLEADEYDRSFLQLQPYFALVTSMDADHLDIYGTDLEIKKSFQDFASLVRDGGVLLVSHKLNNSINSNNGVQKLTYSLDNEEANFYASHIELKNGKYCFDLNTPEGLFKQLTLGIPGLLNVENAIGALALAVLSGAQHQELQDALLDFKGIRRRFDYQINTDDLVLIDDYAHHPEEINSTLNSVRALYPNKKITGVFQPHLYSRTKDFYKEFAKSLSQLDELVMLDIYPARELPIEGVNSEMILDLVQLDKKMVSTKDDLYDHIKALKPQVILAMGAGDIDKEIQKLVSKFKEN